MFNSGNSTPFSMPVAPIGNMGNCGGMGGWGNDWIALAILALIFGDGWGMGGMGGMGMFLPFMFMNGGWGGFGGNCGGNGGALTRGELCQDMNFQSLENAVGRLSDNQALQFTQLNNGMCNLGYQNAQLINGVQMQIANEFRGTDNAICNLGFQTQQGFNQTNIALMQGQNALATQLADCCCRTQSGLKEIQFQNAQDTCATTTAIAQAARDIVDNQNLNYRALHDEIVANRIEDKNAIIAQQNQQIFQYQLAASQAGQTADIKNGILTELRNCPVGTYPVPNPNCCYGANITFGIPYNNGYGNGCDCNRCC